MSFLCNFCAVLGLGSVIQRIFMTQGVGRVDQSRGGGLIGEGGRGDDQDR